jgi:Domain of unknown function (DUF4331)
MGTEPGVKKGDKTVRKFLLVGAAGLAAAVAAIAWWSGPEAARSASHREAPLISLDPAADITDFFAFRSYEAGKSDRVVFLMDVFPGGEPSSGPNYFHFDPSVRYDVHVDNNKDGKADDVRFELRFRNEIRGTVRAAGLPLSYLGRPGSPFPPITALDGPGSEGLGLRQRYTVTMVRDGKRDVLAKGLIAVPSNVGPFTTPGYESLRSQGTYTIEKGIRVFAGQRQDPFYIDLGAVFDTLNFRRPLPLLTPAEDANDDVNPFGTDMLSGFNVQTIALEVPIGLLTKDRKGPDATSQPKLGSYGSTSRPKVTVRGKWNRHDYDRRTNRGHRKWVQVQRLANPLVNELIIGTVDKDRWNALEPEDEGRFVDYYLNPRLALALQAIYGVPAGTMGRQDLVDLLLKYRPGDMRLSELLRLDVSVAPTGPTAAQRRLGPLATPADPAAWPNGRRPKDDVTDIAVRVVGGPNYIAARAGDGVNTNDEALMDAFPFAGTPEDGRNRQHSNPIP